LYGLLTVLRVNLRPHAHPLTLGVAALALYLTGLPQSITWAHSAADSGELAAAAATWGVPHPPGYPVYILLGKLFLFIPWGDPAHRLAVMSAVAGTGAVVLIWYLIREMQYLTSNGKESPSRWPATVGAGALVVSPIFWSQAIVVEVYALNALFFAGVAFLLAGWWRRQQSWPARKHNYLWLLAGATLLGLGLGNHLTLALLVPLVGGAVWWGACKGFLSIRRIGFVALALLTGLGLYAYLPIASSQGPPINWGIPSNWTGFVWTVSGTPYQPYLFGLPIDALPDRIVSWLRLVFLEQFTPVGAGLALLGALHLWERNRPLLLASAWVVLSLTLYAITYDSKDSDVFLIPVFMALATWLALGVDWALQVVGQSSLGRGRPSEIRVSGMVIAAVLIMAPGVTFAANLSNVPLRGDAAAYRYAQETLAGVEQGAVIFAETDEELFSLWYGRYALDERPDVTVVSSRLLQYDWYWEQLERRYPSIVPEQIPLGASPRLAALIEESIGVRPIYATMQVRGVQAYEQERVGNLLRLR